MATKTTKVTKVKKAPVAKKTPPNGGVKKTTTKVASPKKSAKKKPLVVVTGECFWVNNGASLCSLKDLHETFRTTMSEDQYSYHTGMGRNDFSAWVADVLGDKQCSKDLLKAKNKRGAISVVEKHLKNYTF